MVMLPLLFQSWPGINKRRLRKEFYLFIFEGEKKPTILLEKQLQKHSVYGLRSYLKAEVEDLANNNNDFKCHPI